MEEYSTYPASRKSPETYYSDSKPPTTPPVDDSEHTREILSRLARGSHTLHLAALRGAEHIEVTAIDKQTGEPLDHMWTRHPQKVKKFVRSHRQAFFELRVSAGPTTSRRVIAQLSEPDGYDSTYSCGRLHLLYQLASMTKRVAFVAPQDGTYAWRRVTVSFPRDPGGRATIRGAVVILTVRADRFTLAESRVASAAGPQSSFTF